MPRAAALRPFFSRTSLLSLRVLTSRFITNHRSSGLCSHIFCRVVTSLDTSSFHNPQLPQLPRHNTLQISSPSSSPCFINHPPDRLPPDSCKNCLYISRSSPFFFSPFSNSAMLKCIRSTFRYRRPRDSAYGFDVTMEASATCG